jgi:3-hydroxymyristoyl/3-hydroxydecanoyl-(acyl carrier protein) dehydratase
MNLPPILAERKSADGVVLDLALTENLDVFRGHFPALPVLPGVAQVDWALRLAKSQGLIGRDAELRDFQVKFRNVIRPPLTLTLTLRWDAARQRIQFEYRSGTVAMSSGRLSIQAAPS